VAWEWRDSCLVVSICHAVHDRIETARNSKGKRAGCSIFLAWKRMERNGQLSVLEKDAKGWTDSCLFKKKEVY
jgi:hypothetical protein